MYSASCYYDFLFGRGVTNFSSIMGYVLDPNRLLLFQEYLTKSMLSQEMIVRPRAYHPIIMRNACIRSSFVTRV